MENRFEAVKEERISFGRRTMEVFVLRDKQTGVMYACRTTLSGVGMSVLVDKHGKPMTTFKINI